MHLTHHLQFLDAGADPATALAIEYDPLLVTISYLVATFGSYAALTIGQHLRHGTEGRPLRLWLTAGAVAMGLAVWAMHFIGMLAARIDVPVTYDAVVTGLSIVPAALAGYICLSILGRHDTGRGRILLAGSTMGAGIGVMHYVGMAAMRMNAEMQYDPERFLLSIAFAVVLATAALCIARLAGHIRNLSGQIVTVAGAMVMGLAITAMHYTGMWAVYYFPLDGTVAQSTGIDTTTLASSVAAVSVSITGLAVAALAMSQRIEQARTEARFNQRQQILKMEAIGHLTGGVAHEFNNLLTVILGNLQILASELKEDQVIGGYVQEALTAGQRGAELIKRLLSFSQQQLLSPQTTDVNRVLSKLVTDFCAVMNAGVTLRITAGDELWLTDVDRRQLEGALFNLALNSQGAMQGGGTITIETSNAVLTEADAGRHADVVPGEYVRVTVRDEGAGIPEGVLPRVFEPFFTTKEVGQGTGLGLSMVYGFVKQSKGYIDIRSEQGRGTTVDMYLPRSGPASLQVTGSTVPAAQSAKRRNRILLVEDDAAVRQVGSRILKGLGYQVCEAGDAASALAILDDCQDIDLLFSDVVLPGGMSGLNLANHGRQRNRQLKVLYTSGYSDTVMFDAGVTADGGDILHKPYRREELAEMVRRILGPPPQPRPA